MEKLENRAWNRELVRAAYASPRRPRWLGGTLAAWLGLGEAGAAHRHGLGCDFGYDFSQMTKMCIVTQNKLQFSAVPRATVLLFYYMLVGPS